MPDLIVTLVQSDLVWEDREANLTRFDAVMAGVDAAADLVILPEMFSTGFSMTPARLAETMTGQTVAWLLQQAERLQAVVMASAIIEEDGRYYNRLISAHPGGTCHTYDKRHLFRMAGEDQVYGAGDRVITVTVNGWRVRPFICYDLRFPAWTRNMGNDYDLAVFVANWPEKRAMHWQTLLRARAIENLCYVAGVNRVGTDGNGIAYSGDSAVIAPDGEVMAEKHREPWTRTLTLSGERLAAYRNAFPAWMDADGEMIRLPDDEQA